MLRVCLFAAAIEGQRDKGNHRRRQEKQMDAEQPQRTNGGRAAAATAAALDRLVGLPVDLGFMILDVALEDRDADGAKHREVKQHEQGRSQECMPTAGAGFPGKARNRCIRGDLQHRKLAPRRQPTRRRCHVWAKRARLAEACHSPVLCHDKCHACQEAEWKCERQGRHYVPPAKRSHNIAKRPKIGTAEQPVAPTRHGRCAAALPAGGAG